MKLYGAIIAAGVALSSPSMAADVYSQGGSYKDAPIEQAFSQPKVNWTGVYIGGRAGYGNANHELTVEGYDNDPSDPGAEGYNENFVGYYGQNDVSSVELLNLNGLNSSGFIGGGQIGVDKQMGRFVVGVFGSYDFSNMETTLDLMNNTAQFSLEKEYEWDAGIRAGVLVNSSTLVYALAAYTETEYSLNGPGVSEAEGLDDEKKFSGVKVGAGIEYAATNNIFLGLEGTHTFYGEENWFDADVGGEGLRVDSELDETKVMGTLKIKLNSGVFGN